MAYGQEGNRFYVNSAQRWSREKVEERFDKEEKGDGSVSLGFIETITGGADLKGNWEIRSHIEASFLPAGEARLAQRRAARRQAQRIMREFAFPTADGLPYISKADLDARLAARKAAIREGQLQRAAALKPSPWGWQLSGPRSDD